MLKDQTFRARRRGSQDASARLRRRGTALALLAGASTLAGLADVAHAATSPIRPPAVPLITRSPYLNVYLPNTTGNAVGTWPAFYTGGVKAITGIAYIDGAAYEFLGAPGGVPNLMTQSSLTVTATQSKFVFNAHGVNLSVDFLSPIEATDIKRLSMPIADIITTAQSSDGANHTVTVYFDISGEWAHGDSNALIKWSPETINRNADGSTNTGTLATWTVSPNSPGVLTSSNEYCDWGTALFSTANQTGLTVQSGADTVVRPQFVSHGTLTGANDTNQPRAINNAWPCFAFSKSFGTVGTTATSPFTLLLGHVRNPDVSYLGANIQPLWLSYWATYEAMLAFAYNDGSAALTRANTLDTNVNNQATAAGGAHYAALTAMSLRQAFAGTEMVNTSGNPWMMLEEISSDSNVQTVDVAYPSMPGYLAVNPELVRYLITPLMTYAESGHWPQPYAEHDLGPTYPNASGHNDGGGENMPVEETANMLIMADAYMRGVPPAEATAYAQAHYTVLKNWANYLLTVPSGVTMCNALDPQFQNQTDDFLGSIAHSSNLALKGIIAVGAMGQIAAFAGNSTDAASFNGAARSLISQWATLSQNSNSTHLLLQYKEAANAYSPDTTGEPDTAWSLKYNEFPDKLLGLNLVPQNILTEEAAGYKTHETATGIALDYRADTTKSDWQLWAAAGYDDATLRQNIFDEVFNYENTSPSAQASPDLYHTGSTSTAFHARPVVGGFFAPLVRNLAASNPISAGVHTLTPICATNVRLDDNAAGTANGNKVQVWTANGSAAQQWNFANIGGSNWNLAVNLGPYCLDSTGSTVSGTQVQIWACNGATTQSWGSTQVSSVIGTAGYILRPANATTMCLNDYHSGNTDGNLATVTTCNGTQAQTWAIN